MTVPSTAERNDYTGNGTTATYAYGFRITLDSHLLVTVADTDGAETTLTKTTDYTVTNVGIKTGGNIVLVDSDQAWLNSSGYLKTGYHLTVRHYVPLAQAYDIRNLGAYYPETHEDALDYLMVAVKQQQDEIDRCVKAGETVTGVTPIFPAPEDGKSLVWSGTSGQMVNSNLKGEKGDTGATGPTGPQGEKGDTGATGPTGPQGPQGPQGDVAVDGTVNPTNLVGNGNFEAWSAGASAAPDGWTFTGASATITREATIFKIGAYSAKITRAGADAALSQTYTNESLLGRPHTFGCWVYATVASRARLVLLDGDTTPVYSAYHTGNSTWQFLTCTFTPSVGQIIPRMLVDTGDTSAYFDGAILVEGASAFAFSPKPAEEGVWVDYSATSTIVGWASFSGKQIYTKKIGKTVFVSFDILGTSNATGVTFTLPYTSKTGFTSYFCGHATDNGTGGVNPGSGNLPGASATVAYYKDNVGNAWTNSGIKRCAGQFQYEEA